ncbi:hypothetical protein NLN82_27675, partial [Citrobacter portucalensis]
MSTQLNVFIAESIASLDALQKMWPSAIGRYEINMRDVFLLAQSALKEKEKAAENATRTSDGPQRLPPLNDALIQIFAVPDFLPGILAGTFRLRGDNIPCISEYERAHVLYWMLNVYLEHGDGWRDVATMEIERIVDEQRARNRQQAEG